MIPKSTKASRIAENIDVFDFELSTAELREIDGLDSGHCGGEELLAVTLEAFGRDIPEVPIVEPGPQNDNQESEQADLAERVREALVRIDIMALSTIGPDGPWTSPVQYQHNDELELFFMPQPDTNHGQGGSGRHERANCHVIGTARE